ncbi:T9SS type A sorting domain-containing protein, partial [Faecalibacter macacae]
SEGDTRINQVMIGYFEGATDEEDFQRDARTVETGSKKIYTLIDENQFSIQSRTYPLNQEDVVKLGFVTDKHGQLKISLGDIEGIFGNEQSVYLKDNLLGIIHDLKDSDYVFESEEGKFDDRFEIVYNSKSLSTTPEVTSSNEVKVYQTGGLTYVISEDELINEIEVLDSFGRFIRSEKSINKNKVQFNLISGVYYLKIKLNTDKVVTVKVLVK